MGCVIEHFSSPPDPLTCAFSSPGTTTSCSIETFRENFYSPSHQITSLEPFTTPCVHPPGTCTLPFNPQHLSSSAQTKIFCSLVMETAFFPSTSPLYVETSSYFPSVPPPMPRPRPPHTFFKGKSDVHSGTLSGTLPDLPPQFGLSGTIALCALSLSRFT